MRNIQEFKLPYNIYLEKNLSLHSEQKFIHLYYPLIFINNSEYEIFELNHKHTIETANYYFFKNFKIVNAVPKMDLPILCSQYAYESYYNIFKEVIKDNNEFNDNSYFKFLSILFKMSEKGSLDKKEYYNSQLISKIEFIFQLVGTKRAIITQVLDLYEKIETYFELRIQINSDIDKDLKNIKSISGFCTDSEKEIKLINERIQKFWKLYN